MPLESPEGGECALEASGAPDMSGGAPDTVRWHTGQSGAPDQGAFGMSLALLV